jgi:hypothetical protein
MHSHQSQGYLRTSHILTKLGAVFYINITIRVHVSCHSLDDVVCFIAYGGCPILRFMIG